MGGFGSSGGFGVCSGGVGPRLVVVGDSPGGVGPCLVVVGDSPGGVGPRLVVVGDSPGGCWLTLDRVELRSVDVGFWSVVITL